MSNYPNMSYCMVENTCNAMAQVIQAMQECNTTEEFIEDLNKTEKRQFQRLVMLCETFFYMTEQDNDD